MLERVLVCLLSGGYLLIEGVPGLAKTLTIKTAAAVLGGTFNRIQFTPDLVPSDLVGTRVFRPDTATFSTEQGPVFCNFLLADEINRAPAKVQSALLEVMQEHQVTIGRETHAVPVPFLVMATQNPIESEGTYPLPEAQVDRFMLKVLVGYPDPEDELTVVERALDDEIEVQRVVSLDELAGLRKRVRRVYVDPAVSRYAVVLAGATRSVEAAGVEEIRRYVEFGASPRGSIALVVAGRALALIRGRDYVLPQDLAGLAHDVLRHRLELHERRRLTRTAARRSPSPRRATSATGHARPRAAAGLVSGAWTESVAGAVSPDGSERRARAQRLEQDRDGTEAHERVHRRHAHLHPHREGESRGGGCGFAQRVDEKQLLGSRATGRRHDRRDAFGDDDEHRQRYGRAEAERRQQEVDDTDAARPAGCLRRRDLAEVARRSAEDRRPLLDVHPHVADAACERARDERDHSREDEGKAGHEENVRGDEGSRRERRCRQGREHAERPRGNHQAKADHGVEKRDDRGRRDDCRYRRAGDADAQERDLQGLSGTRRRKRVERSARRVDRADGEHRDALLGIGRRQDVAKRDGA